MYIHIHTALENSCHIWRKCSALPSFIYSHYALIILYSLYTYLFITKLLHLISFANLLCYGSCSGEYKRVRDRGKIVWSVCWYRERERV